MKLRLVGAGLMVLAAAACAKQPGEIAAVSVGDAYSGVSCSRASSLYNAEAAKVPALVSKQKSAVAGDAVGVFLLGVPMASLSGEDLEGEIAATKGKILALTTRLETCGINPAPVDWG